MVRTPFLTRIQIIGSYSNMMNTYLVIVERAGVVWVTRRDRPHAAAAVPHHRLLKQLPSFVLHRAGGTLPLRPSCRCVRFGRARCTRASVGAPQAHIAYFENGIVVVLS
jgi:hypothetical protein